MGYLNFSFSLMFYAKSAEMIRSTCMASSELGTRWRLKKKFYRLSSVKEDNSLTTEHILSFSQDKENKKDLMRRLSLQLLTVTTVTLLPDQIEASEDDSRFSQVEFKLFS